MMKLKATACIDAPKEKVWEYLSDVSNIHQWVATLSDSSCEGEQTRGVGTVRVCQLQNNTTFRERFVAWDEGCSFTYQAENPPMMMKQAQNTWTVTPVNGKTLLTTEAELEMKGGVFGKLLWILMKPMIHKMGREALASFKYLVENGRPYEGKPSTLPRAPITC